MAAREYDYVVVGGGSAGCVVAARLSENPGNRVLLLESGRRDRHLYIHIPATFFKVIDHGRDVHLYEPEANPGMDGRRAIVPTGNVLGGGSSVNSMIYMRGDRLDYDSWAQMGCRNWSFDKVLPVFKELEANERFSGDYHGADGPLRVSDTRYGHPLSKAFLRAAQEVGLSYNDDFNGEKQDGVGFYQVTTSGGRRCSAAVAFLRAAEGRPNLTVMTETRVRKLVFERARAVGVLLQGGETVRFTREAILTAGAIATPKILLLSGIGHADQLREFGIDVVADLPGVGENYQDHVSVASQAELKHPMSLFGHDRGFKGAGHLLEYLLTRRGLLSSNVTETGGFIDTAGVGRPDVQFHVVPSFLRFENKMLEGHGIFMSAYCLRPQSRGSVKLRSADPMAPALFQTNALTNPADLEGLVRVVQQSIRFMEAPSLAKIIKRRVMPEPGVENDPRALRNFIRANAKTAYHPSCTAKMGPAMDKMAVVGEDLKVHGIDGLRIADASIMPNLISGNTNAPVIMIGERAARFILGREQVA